MESKLEILEQLRTNVINARDSDFITDDLTQELNRIEQDLTDAIDDEKQIVLLDKELKKIELQKRLNDACKNDKTHTQRLSQ